MIDRRIIGRAAETAMLLGALDDLSLRGTALLIHGEAGIGKSVLLEALRWDADARGLTVLATAGVETEAGFPYAGLHRLLRPLVGEIDSLGELQRRALKAALGLGEDQAGDPFLVAIAVLELLSARAARGPVVILADDLQWLDGASRRVLGFVGRRVGDRRILVVAAMRTGYEELVGELGLPALALGGVDDASAAEILADRASDLTGPVRARLLAEAAGNPLALVELPAAATAEAARDSSGFVLPISTRLERAFARRLNEMPKATRSLLLVASADEASAVGEILAAGALLGETALRRDLAPAIDAGLISLHEDTIRYRHPLVRSAIYQAASLEARLAAHAALAEVLDVDGEADRRAWHRAAATVVLDDEVAREVEAVAWRAHARGAILDAAVTLGRAARLTQDTDWRAQRLLRSAELAFEAGSPEVVRVAVEEAQRLSLGVRDRARAELLSEVFYDGVAGDVSRVITLVDDAREVAAMGDTDLSLALLQGAGVRCWWASLDASVRARVLAAAEDLPVSPLEPRLLATIACVAPTERGAEIVERAPEAIAAAAGDPLACWFVAVAAHAVGDHALSLSILTDVAPVLREHGRFGLLAQVLSMMQWDAALLGEWAITEATAEEGDRLAHDTGQRVWGAGLTCGLAAVAAVRGDSKQAEKWAADAERVVLPHGLADMHSVLLTARGITAIAEERYDDAYAILQRAFDPADPAYHYREQFGALAFFAEAAAACGREAEARTAMRTPVALASRTAAPALRVNVSFAEEILTGDAEADEESAAGLAEMVGARPFQRARLQFAHGRRLASAGRIAEARAALSAAEAGFEEAGAPPWQRRVRTALTALPAVSGGGTALSNSPASAHS